MKNEIKKPKSFFAIFSLIMISFIVLCVLFIIFYLLALSFINFDKQIASTKYKDYTYLVLPNSFYIQNYLNAFDKLTLRNAPSIFTGVYSISIWEQYLNTILFAIGGALVGALCPCIVAYATSNYDYKFNIFIDGLVLTVMVLPIVGATPATVDMVYNVLHIDNSFFGLYFMCFSFTNMYYFMFKSAFLGIPKSLPEAAKLDGASDFTIFRIIMLPLIKTVFLAIFVLLLVARWNEYSHTLYYAPNMPTAAYGMFYLLVLNNNSLVTEKMAGAVVMTIPVLVLYITCNKFLMGNLTIGGVKG